MLRSSVLPALLTLMTAVSAAAAEQGSVGATTRGSVFISASVAGVTRISGLHDTDLHDGRAAMDVCARSNTKTRLYSIVATGGGDADGGVRYRIALSARSGEAIPRRAGLPIRDLIADPYGAPCERRALFVADQRKTASPSDRETLTVLVAPD